MSKRTLNIVAFDIPYPANYGGVIDIFFKIRSLKAQGVDVILHCFQYGRTHSKQLDQICSEVFYYNRKTYTNLFSANKPYIVASRNSEELLQNLQLNHHPILFEGLHTTLYLNHPSLKSRFKVVRMHNIEHHYYKHLELIERNYFKKYFFRIESERLKRYQKVLKHAQGILAISHKDYKYYKNQYEQVTEIGPFHANDEILNNQPKKDFVLYHGNLAVGENDDAALYLCQYVFPKLKSKAIIAGNNPSGELKKLISSLPNVNLQANLKSDQIHTLIEEAKVNVLFTNQSTGVKLKLINVLYRGGHCVVNTDMIKGTDLKPAVVLADTSHDMIDNINECLSTPFSEELMGVRQTVLQQDFDNAKNAEKLIKVFDFTLA